MGNSKPSKLRSTAAAIYKKYKDSFTTDFTQNKKMLTAALPTVKSDFAMNRLAGWITHKKTLDMQSE